MRLVLRRTTASSTDHGGGKRRGFNAADALNHGVSLILSVVQWRYGSAFSHQRRLHEDLDIFSYLLRGLFGRFICSKSGLQLSVDGHIILFDERRCGAYWR